MADFEKLNALVAEYQKTYRAANLHPFEFIEPYELDSNEPCPVNAAKRGVYAIFSGDELIYIGKSSSPNRAIWHRIVDHFQFNYNKPRKTKWSKEPTHFVGWAVPDESFFEASALEEYLIYKLKSELPDNVIGK